MPPRILIATLLLFLLPASCKTDHERELEQKQRSMKTTAKRLLVLQSMKSVIAEERKRLVQLAVFLRPQQPLPRNDKAFRELISSGKIPPLMALDIWKRPRYCQPIPRGGVRICSMGWDGKRSLDDQCVELVKNRIELFP